MVSQGVATIAVGQDGGSFDLARYGGLLNATAVGLFLVVTVGSAILHRVHAATRTARPVEAR